MGEQLAAGNGDIHTIIGGIAPDWGPFSQLGAQGRLIVDVIMATAVTDR
jgi:hypothetical protein